MLDIRLGIVALTAIAMVSTYAFSQQEKTPAEKRLAGEIQSVQIPSPHQANETTLRILLPTDFDQARQYRVLYVLPVHEDGQFRHGDGLAIIRKHGFHDQHQLICVAPSFTSEPWYADHAFDSQKQDESHLLKTVLPFVEQRYPTVPGVKGRLLIGFSKSGWGAISLLLRNPKVFHRAAAWDTGIRVDTGPIEEVDRAKRISRNWGTRENFEAHRISNLVKQLGTQLGDEARLFYYNTQGKRAAGGVEIHSLLVKHLIPHRYVMEPRRKHEWDSGWLPQAVAFLTATADRK